jgi:MGT family glycosyltransferase
LSTSRQGQLPLLRRIAAALGGMPVRAVLTTGLGVDPADVPAAPNVQVVESAPHSEVLRHAAAVVTHAGHGTVIKALAEGVPLIALPMGRDQLEVAARVVAVGAGVRLRPGASAAAIARAVRTVLATPSYRAGARRMAETIERDRAAGRAAAELEELAGHRASVLARAG